MNAKQNALYVVATPIGNLGDMSQRAIDILQQVDVIAAEDTRHSGKLLQHFAIDTPCIAFHEHNERQISAALLKRIQQGESVALISDAGTPLMSDPGYHLIREARNLNLNVVPIPGPSAIISALSVAGLPTDCFKFCGFLSAKSSARRTRLDALKDEACTLVFFESPHRISAALADMAEIFGEERLAVVARELTKTFETIKRDSLGLLQTWVGSDEHQRKGEMVIMVHGAEAVTRGGIDPAAQRILAILLVELPLKQAASLAAKITGIKKNLLYQSALEQKKSRAK